MPRALGRRAGPDGRVLAYDEHGELRFGSHRGPASRSLLYRDLADGSADVRFADGREFYRLDLRSGTWSAEHPCRADQYLVTVTRLSPDSFTEAWRVSGPAKDYELTTTYTRAAATSRPARQRDRGAYAGTIPRLLAAAADRDGDGVWVRSDQGTLTFAGAVAAVGMTADALRAAGVRKGDLVMLTARTTPPYLLCWLAVTTMGAIAVAVNPRSSAAELAGLISQVEPKLLVTDAGLADLRRGSARRPRPAGRAEASRGPTPFPAEVDVHRSRAGAVERSGRDGQPRPGARRYPMPGSGRTTSPC